MTNAPFEAPILLEDERQQQPLLASPPPLPQAPRRASSSSCFLAEGILDDGEGDANREIGRNAAAPASGAAASTSNASTSTSSAAAARELARAAHSKTQKRLAVAVALACGFMVAEVVGGALANSLAIMSDAAHLLSDVAGMVREREKRENLGFFLPPPTSSLRHMLFFWKKKLPFNNTRASPSPPGPPRPRRALPGSPLTYGHHRAEVLGVLATTAATWAVTAALVVAAVGRLRRPERVDGKLMFFMAVVGVFVNVLLLFVLEGRTGTEKEEAGILTGAEEAGILTRTRPRTRTLTGEQQLQLDKGATRATPTTLTTTTREKKKRPLSSLRPPPAEEEEGRPLPRPRSPRRPASTSAARGCMRQATSCSPSASPSPARSSSSNRAGRWQTRSSRCSSRCSSSPRPRGSQESCSRS